MSSGAAGGRTQAEISAHLHLSCQGTFALAQLPGGRRDKERRIQQVLT